MTPAGCCSSQACRRRFSFRARNGDPLGFLAGTSKFDYISRLVTRAGTKEEVSGRRPFVPVLAIDRDKRPGRTGTKGLRPIGRRGHAFCSSFKLDRDKKPRRKPYFLLARTYSRGCLCN